MREVKLFWNNKIIRHTRNLTKNCTTHERLILMLRTEVVNYKEGEPLCNVWAKRYFSATFAWLKVTVQKIKNSKMQKHPVQSMEQDTRLFLLYSNMYLENSEKKHVDGLESRSSSRARKLSANLALLSCNLVWILPYAQLSALQLKIRHILNQKKKIQRIWDPRTSTPKTFRILICNFNNQNCTSRHKIDQW